MQPKQNNVKMSKIESNKMPLEVISENKNGTNFQVVEGSRLPVKMCHSTGEDEEWPLAEILSIRHLQDGSRQFYVHFVDYNKRYTKYIFTNRSKM